MRADNVEFHPEAVAEAAAAHAWYARRSPGASRGFILELDRTVAAIKDGPERWPVGDLRTRRLPLRRFPYWVVYRVLPDVVQVLAIAHMRRRPGYWRRRT